MQRVSGEVERGRVVMRDLFAEYGMSYPSTPIATMAKIIGNRIRLRLQSLEPECTDAASGRLLAQLALCEAGYQGFVLVDTMRSAYFAGLGLFLVREFCAMNGAEVHYYSDYEKHGFRVSFLIQQGPVQH